MNMKKSITMTGIAVGILFLSGFGCKTSSQNYDATLEMWGVFDNTNAFEEQFTEYENINKNVNPIKYHKHTIESYKQDLLNALAAGNGPDIFMIHNSWIPDFQDKIVPAPDYMMTEQEFGETFVDVVADDFLIDGQVYGVPLSVDSLALYYNKDIFNEAGITAPPKTWDQFNTAVKALTSIDDFGNIEQSAGTIGTAQNVNRSPDILTVMMMQNGTEMSNKTTGNVTFASPVTTDNTTTVPGEQALKYYTDFANASSPVYTWNKKQNYSIDEFFEGRAAMMINYSYHYDNIQSKNAKLDFAVVDLPQIEGGKVGDSANLANYWVLAVAKNKQPTQSKEQGKAIITPEIRVHESWQLLRALTFPSASGITIMNAVNGDALVYNVPFDFTEKFLEKTGKPAARKDLIEKQKTDIKLGAFARGNLIAESWWRNSSDAVDAIFADMIDSVNTGSATVHDALELAESRAQQLQKQPEGE